MYTNNNFSACFREKQLTLLQDKTFDLLVIGGGITGAGIALDAVHRGLNVALIEQNDFASGTSSRSTKLVHGGLRYLEKLQLKFVMQLGRERKILHRNNVQNVIPTPMLLPIYKNGKLNKILTRIALFIYDKLAGVNAEYKTQWIKIDALCKKYDFINTTGLKGAFLYYEYKTTDARMVVEMLKKASLKQLTAINYTAFQSGIENNKQLVGINALDTIANKNIKINAKCIVNASGAWCKQIIDAFKLEMPKDLFFTKGVHIVIEKQKLPIKEAFYFDTPDHRMIFAIPKQNHVYIGTTDTPFNEDLSNPEANSNDIEYLINATNAMFSGKPITNLDIVSCWSGIRSLVKEKKGKPSEISRREELFQSPNGLISITGGKLTGYRLMAQNVVDLVYKTLPYSMVKSTSADIKFSGSEWTENLSTEKLVEIADNKFDEAKQTGISANHFKPLFYRYGTNIDILTEKAYELMTVERDPERLWLKTEVWYAINYEMTCTLSSFFIYRTEMVLFEPDKTNESLEYVADEMAALLNWSKEQYQLEIMAFKNKKRQYKINTSL